MAGGLRLKLLFSGISHTLEALPETVWSKDRMSKRLDFIAKMHGDDLVDTLRRDETRSADLTLNVSAVLKEFRAFDPTRNASCTQWIIQRYIAGDFLYEDLGKIADTLQRFLDHKVRLPADRRDIGRYASWSDMADVLDRLPPVADKTDDDGSAADLSGKERDRRERAQARDDSDLLIDERDLIVAIPKTVEAARWWGRGTRWCTASERGTMFDVYSRRGPLVVFVAKGKKYQFHAPSRQFMDDADRSAKAQEVLHPYKSRLASIPGLSVALGIATADALEDGDAHIQAAIERFGQSPWRAMPAERVTFDVVMQHLRTVRERAGSADTTYSLEREIADLPRAVFDSRTSLLLCK